MAETEEYEAQVAGNWPDETPFKAGDRVAKLPAQDEAWLLRAGVFKRVKREPPTQKPEAPDAAQ